MKLLRSTVTSIITKWKPCGTTRTLKKIRFSFQTEHTFQERVLSEKCPKRGTKGVLELTACNRRTYQTSTVLPALHRSGFYEKAVRERRMCLEFTRNVTKHESCWTKILRVLFKKEQSVIFDTNQIQPM